MILGKVRGTSGPGIRGGGAQENLVRGGQGRGGGGQFPSVNELANVPPAPGNGEGRNRTKLKSSETKARLNERPNTVVIDGYEFSVLPSPTELAQFMFDCVFRTNTDKELLTKIRGVFVDENKR